MSRGGRKPAELKTLPGQYQKYFSERPEKPKTETMPRRTWQVSEIKDLHHEIIRRILLGQKDVYIADQTECSSATVRNVRTSPIVRERLSVLRASRDKKTLDVSVHIQKIAPKSIRLLEDVIEGKGQGEHAPLALRVRCAESNLDRAGHGAVKRFQGAVGHFTSEDIQDLKTEALKRVGPIAVTAGDKTSETSPETKNSVGTDSGSVAVM